MLHFIEQLKHFHHPPKLSYTRLQPGAPFLLRFWKSHREGVRNPQGYGQSPHASASCPLVCRPLQARHKTAHALWLRSVLCDVLWIIDHIDLLTGIQKPDTEQTAGTLHPVGAVLRAVVEADTARNTVLLNALRDKIHSLLDDKIGRR